MRTIVISGQFQLRTPFSRPEGVRLRELPLYSFTHLIKKSNLFSFFFNKQWFICPLPEPQRSVMWASYLKNHYSLVKCGKRAISLNWILLLLKFLRFCCSLFISSRCTNTWWQPLWWTSIPSRECINPLSPSSDQHPISLDNNTAWSNIHVMRMNEMITKDEMSWCLNKFSQAVPYEMYEEWCW